MSDSAERRIAVVPARFGPQVIGGAEIVLRRLAEGLQARDWSVEVLTSCATDHFGWDNVLPAGCRVEDGLTVRRFPAVLEASAERGVIEHEILAGAPVPLRRQYRWMNEGMRAPELYHYLLDHAGGYRALIFGPYLFWPAFAGAQVAPERSVLWACLHDEPYAYLDLFAPVLGGVAGLLLQSEPEHALAHRLVASPAPHAVTGCGVEVPDGYDVEGFRRRHRVPERFLLYAGRREGAKGFDELLRMFAAAVVRRSLPFGLVTIGGGEVRPPAEVADRVVDLGFLPPAERDAAFAAADGYLQPSRYEAFSLTVMEAWLAGTPVIANGASAVVRDHCERSGAGLVYDDEAEFAECLDFLAAAPAAGRALAAPGRDYVLANYRWPDVLDRVERAVLEFTAAAPVAGPMAAAEG